MVTSKENFDQQNDSTTKKWFHKEKKNLHKISMQVWEMTKCYTCDWPSKSNYHLSKRDQGE